MEITSVFPSSPDSVPDKDIREAIPFSTFNSETSRGREVTAIVAMSSDRAIGRDGSLPWHLPEDMAHFKATTMGHPVIMGRKTWESLPKRPLPGRRNIVVTGNPDYTAEGAEVFASPEAAIAACPSTETPVIMGGAQLYHCSLPMCTRLIVTEVKTTVPDPDTFFPVISDREWSRSECGEWLLSKKGLEYRFVTYLRK